MALLSWIYVLHVGLSLISEVMSSHHVDRSAMLTLLSELSPHGWDSKTDYCSWTGVFCNSTRSVQVLEVHHQGLRGNITAVSELKSLKWLDFSLNNFHGAIPHTLGNLGKLEFLDLSGNRFDSLIPWQLGNIKNLVTLNLSDNLLTGEIPRELGRLEKLQDLQMSGNRLGGIIPDTIGDLPNLRVFTAHENLLVGRIPDNLGLVSKLESLNFHSNQLEGPIPDSIFASGSLQVLVLTRNNLEGNISSSFGNCKHLSNVRIGNNRLVGSIPKEICDLNTLTYFEADNNKLSGEIVPEFARCSNLTLLNLASNNLTGKLPPELGQLVNLQELIFSGNDLIGEVPRSFVACRDLNKLDLCRNRFNGTFPGYLCNISRLQFLLLSDNSITGEIPHEIGTCIRLLELQLGGNNLSGVIPTEIGRMRNLQIALNLSFNHLHGSLPREIGSLDKLVSLDVSNNLLSGHIPADFKGMVSLIQVNFSNNLLTGSVPSFGPFQSSPVSSFSGNERLCGDPLSFSCHDSWDSKDDSDRHRTFHKIILVVLSSCFALSATVALTFLLFRMEKPEMAAKAPSIAVDERHDPLIVAGDVFIENIKQAVDFNCCIKAVKDSNKISNGNFSTVYKAIMPSGLLLTVRKLKSIDGTVKHHQTKMIRELERLGKLCHSNLLKPVGFVIYEDVALLLHHHLLHGTLSQFLQESARGNVDPDWPKRLSIATGVAEGLAFLHRVAIVHFDVSSNNVFLDTNYNPLVGEIESSKLLNPSRSTGSISAVTGSIGYIPPEYAYTMRVTASGNVYSYGVILLEILTTRLPVDEAFGDGMDLVSWVHAAPLRGDTPEHILDVKLNTVSFTWRQQMLAVLKIALICTEFIPSKRPKMKKVVEMLHEIVKD